MATVDRRVCDYHDEHIDAVGDPLTITDGTKTFVVDVCRECRVDITGPLHPVRAERAPRRRKATRRSAPRASSNGHKRATVRTRKAHNDEIRAWARTQRMPVAARGKIPAAVEAAYAAANN